MTASQLQTYGAYEALEEGDLQPENSPIQLIKKWNSLWDKWNINLKKSLPYKDRANFCNSSDRRTVIFCCQHSFDKSSIHSCKITIHHAVLLYI